MSLDGFGWVNDMNFRASRQIFALSQIKNGYRTIAIAFTYNLIDLK
jgi:hypothetical protein